MNSEALGRLVLPAMEQLPKRIKNLSAAVLCTPDGFNICSLGVNEQQVGKLAALSGSLLSVGHATVTELRPELGEQHMDLLSLKAGSFQVLSMKVNKPVGHLVLLAAAEDVALGAMIIGMQYVVHEIEKIFNPT